MKQKFHPKKQIVVWNHRSTLPHTSTQAPQPHLTPTPIPIISTFVLPRNRSRSFEWLSYYKKKEKESGAFPCHVFSLSCLVQCNLPFIHSLRQLPFHALSLSLSASYNILHSNIRFLSLKISLVLLIYLFIHSLSALLSSPFLASKQKFHSFYSFTYSFIHSIIFSPRVFSIFSQQARFPISLFRLLVAYHFFA